MDIQAMKSHVREVWLVIVIDARPSAGDVDISTRLTKFFGNADWGSVVAPIDTLPSGLVVYAVGAAE